MAGIFGLGDLQDRKAALVAESEVYRQTLRLELQNLRLSILRARKRASFFGSSAPWLIVTAPLLFRSLVSSLFSSRRVGRMRLVTTALVGWQMYRRLSPILQTLFKAWGSRARPKRQSEERASEANI